MQISRLFEIVYLLLERRSVTARELAERFEVSPRTIYRDVDALAQAGIPVYADRGQGGGIRLMEQFVLNKSLLSVKERRELLASVQGMQAVREEEVQPLLENAIYYGVEGMDGEGEIHVKGYRKEDDIYIEVSDNGLGMPQDMVEQLLTDNNRVRKHGSGVGVINVHNRIRLRFGKPYGLEIESMPDEGTTIRIHLPYIPYEPEKLELLENGKMQELKGGKEQ